jgi:hypothetical protein
MVRSQLIAGRHFSKGYEFLYGHSDSDDPVGFRDRLALGLGTLRLGRSSCGGSLPFLRSAVRSHGGRLLVR